MRPMLLLLPLLITALLANRPASAVPFGCCACLAGHEHAMASQAGPAQQVLFCSFVSANTSGDFSHNCEASGGNGIACAPPATNQTCPQVLLADQSLTCPPASPAPAAGHWGLTALALALGGFGLAAMRRRAR